VLAKKPKGGKLGALPTMGFAEAEKELKSLTRLREARPKGMAIVMLYRCKKGT